LRGAWKSLKLFSGIRRVPWSEEVVYQNGARKYDEVKINDEDREILFQNDVVF
jgi:hypothetical protein